MNDTFAVLPTTVLSTLYNCTAHLRYLTAAVGMHAPGGEPPNTGEDE